VCGLGAAVSLLALLLGAWIGRVQPQAAGCAGPA